MVWAASSTFRVGEHHVGVRSGTPEADALLRRLLAAHVVDDPDAPPNYSLQLAPPAPPGAPAQPLHHLYEGHCEVVRDRSPARVLHGLVAALGGFTPAEDPQVLQLRSLVVVGPGGAVLAPAEWRPRLPALRRSLRRAGLAVLDAPVAGLGVTTGEVVVPTPPLQVDAGALAAIGGDAVLPQPAGCAAQPLRGWALLGPAGGPAPAGAAALTAAMRLARNLDRVGGGRALRLLADCLRAVPVVAAPRDAGDREAAVLLTELALP